MLKLFSRDWREVPVTFIDTETTGIDPVNDRAVQIGLVRFEGGKPVGRFCTLVNPGRPIPESATAIHGITDEQVCEAPTVAQVFANPAVIHLLDGAQPAAYNAGFDRYFVVPFGDWTWPWLDALSLVRVVDRFVRGKGRHRLEVTCQRHGIVIAKAHDAANDAQAAGELFYKLMPQVCGHACDQRLDEMTLGQLLRWQREQEASEWFRFTEWLSRQPPLETASNG